MSSAQVAAEVFYRLAGMGISYRLLTHKAVVTMDDCAPLARQLQADLPKNLFLAPRRGDRRVLCLLPPHALYRAGSISAQLGASRLQFASEELLWQTLKCVPGATSPLGLLFAPQGRIDLAIDRSYQRAQAFAMHPCVPHMTVALPAESFFRFLSRLSVPVHWIDSSLQ